MVALKASTLHVVSTKNALLRCLIRQASQSDKPLSYGIIVKSIKYQLFDVHSFHDSCLTAILCMAYQEFQYLLFYLSVLFLLFNYWRRLGRRSSLPYPPGPKGIPFIGNLRDLPSSHPWLHIANWKQTYGTPTFFL